MGDLKKMSEYTETNVNPSGAGQSAPTDTNAGQTNPAGSAGAPPPLPSLEERLEKAEASIQEHRDAFLRAKAESENMRRRAQTDVANANKYALENFATELLAVKDSLEAALGSDNVSAENLKSGVELTLKQLKAAFDKFNIVEENPLQQKFDPHRHQAISMVESEAEPNSVVSVLQKGYKLNERVIRPAMVSVARAKAN